MFSGLSDRLSTTVDKIRRHGKLTEKNIKDSLTQVRRALLEADVALPVVKQFIADIQKKAVGQNLIKKLKPGQTLVKLVHEELVETLGKEHQAINLKAQAPVTILMAGLQGAGKTTTVAKLAQWLTKKEKRRVLVASADVYRPAAIEQLKTVAEQVNVEFFPSTTKDKPVNIAKAVVSHAKKHQFDLVILDTAGRNHVDDAMMDEISLLSDTIDPTETLLVVDSMAGQDAANIAKTFNDRLNLTGIILTKTDGDARGGAALSMRHLTNQPIKFVGTGEKLDGFEAFHPERIASRILGMGDIVSLVEEAEQKIDKAEAEKIAKKLKKGKRFDFNDFLTQLQQMKKMGGAEALMKKLPMGANMPMQAKNMLDDKLFVKMDAMIHSMTPHERQFPAVINGSRKRRIANGSGTTLADIAKMLKQFTQMQKMLKKTQGTKLQKRLKMLQDQLPDGALDNLPDDFS